MSTIEVKVPDIGDFTDVPVIEVLVKPGDTVKAEDSLVTLESDKATMDVPSPAGGVVKSLSVKIGDKVSEGALLLTLETTAPETPSPRPAAAAPSTPQSADEGDDDDLGRRGLVLAEQVRQRDAVAGRNGEQILGSETGTRQRGEQQNGEPMSGDAHLRAPRAACRPAATRGSC